MAKTIEIDDEAYECLQHARQNGESLSELIRRCVQPRHSLDEIMQKLAKLDISHETLSAIDEAVERRRNTPPSHRGG